MIRIFLNSPVGGSGCTTFSANLAYTFSRLGRNVLLTGVEDDSMSLHFEGLTPNERRSSGATAILGNTRNVLPNLQMRVAGEIREKPPEHAMRSMSNGSTGRGQASAYDIQIFDRVHVNAEEQLSESDWTLLLTTSTASCYRQLAKHFDELYSDNAAGHSGGVMTVLNQHVPESPLSTDILDLMSDSMGNSLFPGIFLFDELIRESAANGLPLIEYAPYSANQPLFEMLANHVITHHDKNHAAA